MDKFKQENQNDTVTSKYQERLDQAYTKDGTADPIITQPGTLFGRCREGKSPSISAITLIAQKRGFQVIIGVAPNKVKPIQDTYKKLGCTAVQPLPQQEAGMVLTPNSMTLPTTPLL